MYMYFYSKRSNVHEEGFSTCSSTLEYTVLGITLQATCRRPSDNTMYMVLDLWLLTINAAVNALHWSIQFLE